MRSSAGSLQVIIVPATTALYRLARRLSRGLHLLSSGRQARCRAFQDQMTLAGYDHVTQVVRPGEYSVRGGLIDPLSDGVDAALPDRPSTTRSSRSGPSTRTPSAPSIRSGDPPAPAREFDRRRRPNALSQALPRDLRGRSVARIDLQGRLERHRSGRHRVLPAAVLRRKRQPSSTICRRMSRWPFTSDARALADFWRDTRSRYEMLSAATAPGRCSRRANCFSPTKPSFPALGPPRNGRSRRIRA